MPLLQPVQLCPFFHLAAVTKSSRRAPPDLPCVLPPGCGPCLLPLGVSWECSSDLTDASAPATSRPPRCACSRSVDSCGHLHSLPPPSSAPLTVLLSKIITTPPSNQCCLAAWPARETRQSQPSSSWRSAVPQACTTTTCHSCIVYTFSAARAHTPPPPGVPFDVDDNMLADLLLHSCAASISYLLAGSSLVTPNTGLPPT